MGYRINVKNFKIAPVSVDNSTTYTIGTIVPVPGLMTVDLTMLSSSGELYGDGALVSKIAKLTGATLKIGHDKLPIDVRATLLGATVTNGILDLKTSDTPAKIAVYFETEQDDGTKEQMWLLSGKAEPIGISAKQAEGNINYSTDEITINFIRRELDNKVLRMADTANATFTASAAFAADPDTTGATPDPNPGP